MVHPLNCAENVTYPKTYEGASYSLISGASGFVVGGLYPANPAVGGVGEASLSNGGKVSVNYFYLGLDQGSVGTLSITGPSSQWETANISSIGHYGHAEVSITDGGTFSHSVDASDHYTYIAYAAGSSANILVSGVNGTKRSSLIAMNRIYLGHYGDALMTISDGGSVVAPYTSSIGLYTGSTGELVVTGVNAASGYRSEFNLVNNQLWIGDFGDGALRVLDGGLVTVDKNAYVAGEPTGRGVLIVSGVDAQTGLRSTLAANTGVIIGTSRGTGDAKAWIQDGGQVITQKAQVGSKVGQPRFLEVSGVHQGNTTPTYASLLRGYNVYIGEGGIGVASILNGGNIWGYNSELANVRTNGNILLGSLASGEGQLTVSGVNAASGIRSVLDADNNITVGELGRGELYALAGGLVTADEDLLIGRATGASGLVQISGRDAVTNILSELRSSRTFIGVEGDGALELWDGGVLTSDTALIAANAGSTGRLNIGRGSLAGDLDVETVVGGSGAAVVEFDHTDDAVFQVEFSGSLAMRKAQASTTVLTGSNTHTGGTFISGTTAVR